MTQSLEVVELGASHRRHLERFVCAGAGTSWSREVEDMVRRVPDQLDYDATTIALGGFDDRGALVTVAVAVPMRDDSETWQMAVVATADGHKGRGYGRRIKEDALEHIRAAGGLVCVSFVHSENDAMLHLNAHLGARIEPDYALSEYMLCTIRIQDLI